MAFDHITSFLRINQYAKSDSVPKAETAFVFPWCLTILRRTLSF